MQAGDMLFKLTGGALMKETSKKIRRNDHRSRRTWSYRCKTDESDNQSIASDPCRIMVPLASGTTSALAGLHCNCTGTILSTNNRKRLVECHQIIETKHRKEGGVWLMSQQVTLSPVTNNGKANRFSFFQCRPLHCAL